MISIWLVAQKKKKSWVWQRLEVIFCKTSVLSSFIIQLIDSLTTELLFTVLILLAVSTGKEIILGGDLVRSW